MDTKHDCTQSKHAVTVMCLCVLVMDIYQSSFVSFFPVAVIESILSVFVANIRIIIQIWRVKLARSKRESKLCLHNQMKASVFVSVMNGTFSCV